MAKMFVRFNTASKFTSGSITVDGKAINYTEYYKDSIVFLKDTHQIWSNGTYFSVNPSTVSNLASRVSALENRVSFATISDGTNSASATKDARTIKFAGSNGISVSVGSTGVTINGSTLQDSISTTNSTVSALTTKVKQPAAASRTAITVTKDSAGYVSTIGLKLATAQGNVTLTQTADGLKASTTHPSVPVQGVATDDKVLTLSSTKLSATLGLVYDSTNKLIKLTGKNDANGAAQVISSINAADFVKDGMLKNVTYANKTLTFTWNTTDTTSGKNTITIPLTDLVDTYSGANLKITAISLPSSYTAPAINDTVDTAVSKLTKGIAVINGQIANLTSGKVSTIQATSSKYVRLSATVKSGTATISPEVDYVSSPNETAAGNVQTYDGEGLATAAWVRDVALGWEEPDATNS